MQVWKFRVKTQLALKKNLHAVLTPQNLGAGADKPLFNIPLSWKEELDGKGRHPEEKLASGAEEEAGGSGESSCSGRIA